MGRLIPAWLWKRVLLWLVGNDQAKYTVLARGLAAHREDPAPDPVVIDLDSFVPGSTPYTIVMPMGATVVNAEGARHVQANGVVCTLTRDGELTLQMPGNTRVQIDDVSQLLDHTSVRVHQTTSHTMTFVRGGVLSYLVDDAQTVMEAHVKNLKVNTLEAGVLRVIG